MDTAALFVAGWCLAFGGAFLLWQAWRHGNSGLAIAAAATLLASAILFVLPQSVERGLAFFVPAFVIATGAFTFWGAGDAPVRSARELQATRPRVITAGPRLTRTGLARAYLAICGAPAVAGLLAWVTLRVAPLEFANKVMLAMGVMIFSFTALLVIVLSAARLAPLLLTSIAALGLVVTGLLL